MTSEMRVVIMCRGRNSMRQEVLAEPVGAVVTVTCYDKKNISLAIKCPHNTGGHGDRCKASHPPGVDKVGDGVACPYAAYIPGGIDQMFRTIRSQE